jgi:plasmid stabilization system protein ParE
MTYDVIWLPDAEQELATIWMQAGDKSAITRSANQIDAALRRNAANEGESRPGNRRILFAFPLGVIFRVLPDNRTVQVSRIWRVS